MPRRTQRIDLRLKRAKMNYRITLAALIVLAPIALSVLGVGSYIGYKVVTLSPGLPTVDQITERQPTSSIERDRNGLKICAIGSVKHEQLEANEIPQLVIDAITSSEDKNFFSHSGLDYGSIIVAGVKGLSRGHFSQGGSTITQQTAKDYLNDRKKTFDRKIKEAIVAGRLEEKFSKKVILAIYLNKVNFGSGRYGIETGSKFYFGRSVREASLAQVAMLVGIIPAPEKYNPRAKADKSGKTGMDKAKVRQRYVLGRMLANDKINETQYNEAVREEITIVSDRPDEAKDGQEVCDVGNNFLKKLFKNDADAISMLGWNIQTTIDIRVQSAAKKALEDDLAKIAKRNRTKEMPQGAVVVMNAAREVLAMVGGAPYKPGELNRALDALLPPGSAFKGLVYATGFEKAGMGPYDALSNIATDYWDTGSRTRWTPGNYRGEASDIPIFNVKNAYAESLNIPAVKAICGLRMDVTVPDAFMVNGMVSTDFCRQHGMVKEVIEIAGLAGIKFTDAEKKSLSPSIALGTHPVTPIGLLGAYMAIGLDGNYVQPKIFTKIEGENAPPVPEQEVRRVVSPETVAKVRVLTRAVVAEGTGRKANGALPETVYGKTGTTNNSTNTWFVCYTDSYAAAAWVGYDNGRSLGRDETGASAALPVCIDALRAAYNLEAKMVKAMRQQPKAEAQPAEETVTDQQATEAAPAAAGGVDDIPADDTVN